MSLFWIVLRYWFHDIAIFWYLMSPSEQKLMYFIYYHNHNGYVMIISHFLLFSAPVLSSQISGFSTIQNRNHNKIKINEANDKKSVNYNVTTGYAISQLFFVQLIQGWGCFCKCQTHRLRDQKVNFTLRKKIVKQLQKSKQRLSYWDIELFLAFLVTKWLILYIEKVTTPALHQQHKK